MIITTAMVAACVSVEDDTVAVVLSRMVPLVVAQKNPRAVVTSAATSDTTLAGLERGIKSLFSC